MEQKIDVAQLLKGCPSGMELDCTICDNVYFDEVTPYGIRCYIKNDTENNTIYFHKDGSYLTYNKAKCVIFPKGKTTWEGFQRPFKDGDIIFTHADCTRIGLGNTWISIFKENRNGGVDNYVDYCNEDKDFYTYLDDKCLLCLNEDIIQQRLATEEEKQKLFKAIKDNGYKWNPESKTLEKLPKFKVGDEISKRNSISNSWIIYSVSSEYYGLKLPNGFEGIGVLPISEQDEWELISNKLDKSVEPIFKAGDTVMKKCGASAPVLISSVGVNFYYTYSHTESSIGVFPIAEQDDWVLVPDKFDINVLKPFESKVLVRDVGHHEWEGAIFGRYDGKKFFTIGGLDWGCCIPYEGNEHLHGTTNDCDDFYKNW